MITQTEYLRDIQRNQIGFAVDEKTIEIARKLLKRNRPIDEVMEDTGLNEFAVIQLSKELEK